MKLFLFASALRSESIRASAGAWRKASSAATFCSNWSLPGTNEVYVSEMVRRQGASATAGGTSRTFSTRTRGVHSHAYGRVWGRDNCRKVRRGVLKQGNHGNSQGQHGGEGV